MPRTEHLSNIQSNHIYAVNAQVRYTHHGPRMTTAIIEDQNVQSKIKIPNSLNNIRDEIQQGMNYHFGFCYIAPDGWIKARNPDNTIKPAQDNEHIVLRPMMLSQIANNSQALNGHYLTTLLYVINVKESQQVIKNGKNLSICILNCYANGYLVDVTFWNSDLPIGDLENKWVIFSGFRLKKLVDGKFVLVSSVYSKINSYEGQTNSLPYQQNGKYTNLSCVFEYRNVSQIAQINTGNTKIYSNVEALLKKFQTHWYDGCSVCKKKVYNGVPCTCRPNTDIKVYQIQKIILVDQEQNHIEAAVFDQDIQKFITTLKQPTKLKFNISSSTKVMPTGEHTTSHVITKILL